MVALPAVFLILAWLLLLARDPRHRVIRALTRSFLVTGAWVVLTTELLSVPGWISRLPLTLVWGGACLLLAIGVGVNRKGLAAGLAGRAVAATRANGPCWPRWASSSA